MILEVWGRDRQGIACKLATMMVDPNTSTCWVGMRLDNVCEINILTDDEHARRHRAAQEMLSYPNPTLSPPEGA